MQTIERMISGALVAASLVWNQGPAVADWLEILAAFAPGQEVQAERPPAKPWDQK